VVAVLAPIELAAAATPTTWRVSLSSTERQGNDHSGGSSISPDGRYVSFASIATNFGPDRAECEPGFGAPCYDVFVRDRAAGTTELISVAPNGTSGNRHSFDSIVSGSGRFVAFDSRATNLVSPDPNGTWNTVFLRDRVEKRTTIVSVAADGSDLGHADVIAMTPNARHVLIYAWDTDSFALYLRDRTAATTTTMGNQAYNGDISDDGRWVVFETVARIDPRTMQGWPAIYLLDRLTGTRKLISGAGAGLPQESWEYHDPSMSADGRYIAYSGGEFREPGDAGPFQIYLYDRVTGTAMLVTATPEGTEANANSWRPDVSGDGRFVSFDSYATDLLPCSTICLPVDLDHPWQVFVRDRAAATTSLASLNNKGKPGNSDSIDPRMTRTGRLVLFTSRATNLVGGADTNGVEDAYLRDRGT
jgi:Tol biopolymer transport system component